MDNSNLKLNIKTLFNSPNATAVKDFLLVLSRDDVYSMSQTASGKKIAPINLDEAYETILLFTEDIDRFFSYRRITNMVLSQYLHINLKTIEGHATRHQLVAKVKNLWKEKFKETSLNNGELEEKLLLQSSQPTSPLTVSNKHFIMSDEFSRDFVYWFYSTLNNQNNKDSELDQSIFCSNSSLDLYMFGQDTSWEVHSVGAEDCARGLRDGVRQLGLSFSPNTDSGTQAQQSTHGLVKVLSCGTLHRDQSFVGVFEQEFGLVQSPVDKNWKIFYTKANFKACVSELPSLPPCPKFQIECEQ